MGPEPATARAVPGLPASLVRRPPGGLECFVPGQLRPPLYPLPRTAVGTSTEGAGALGGGTGSRGRAGGGPSAQHFLPPPFCQVRRRRKRQPRNPRCAPGPGKSRPGMLAADTAGSPG